MILVADAGPLHYLVLICYVDVLKPLYQRAVVPRTVAAELQHSSTPVAVRDWMAQLPDWCEIRPDPPFDRELEYLGGGERSAIGLAISIGADFLLMDDRVGRIEAKRRRLVVTGTVGVLAEAHRQNLLDFQAAVARLRQTSFYFDADLIERVQRQL
jgi:hypothetical protein